jgi:hypothetical protein
MQDVSIKGAFGRQARFRDGPLPVLRLAHPVTLDFVQLGGESYRNNLLQYQFTPKVDLALADRQIADWARAHMRNRSDRFAQLIRLCGGAYLFVRVQRDEAGTGVRQIARHLWWVVRSVAEVDQNATLNANLDQARQILVAYYSQPLSYESRLAQDLLRGITRTTLGELALAMRCTDASALAQLKVVLLRLALARRLALGLAAVPFGPTTVIEADQEGIGFEPPIPAAAFALPEAA